MSVDPETNSGLPTPFTSILADRISTRPAYENRLTTLESEEEILYLLYFCRLFVIFLLIRDGLNLWEKVCESHLKTQTNALTSILLKT